MVVVIVQIRSEGSKCCAAWFRTCNAAGILDNFPAIQGVYITLIYSVRKSQQELVSMNCSVSVGIAVSPLG